MPSDRGLTPTQVLLALAARCEAEEPSREFDKNIWFAVDPAAHGRATDRAAEDIARARNNGLTNRDDACVRHAFMSCPHYTTSLDAAVTLVPEGCGWIAGKKSSTTADGVVFGKERTIRLTASTPALALCAAALNARASLTDHKG